MNKLIFTGVAILVAFFLIGYGISKWNLFNFRPPGNQSVGQVKQPPAVNPPTIDPLLEQINSMTLDEKIGQLVLVGLDGTEVDDHIRNLITRYYVGGVILYQKNITGVTQLLNLLNRLKATNAGNKIPLLLSLDEEGGRVTRMPGELTKLPGNQIIGQVNNPAFSFQIGQVIAEELKGFGFNLNFAPVLDINRNPRSPVIGDRSFGNNPQVVSELGVQTMKGLQAGGVIPVVKHFPGHGDTAVDSHIDLPKVDNDLDMLGRFELIPFRDAVNNGADAVMVAHILLPKIDPSYPASLSRRIITDLLKNELQFTGLVVTDDMTMGAITENYGIGRAAVQSIIAGSDLVLVCHDYQKELAVLDALKKAVTGGIISESRIDASVYKILKLKQKYGLQDQPVDNVNVAAINHKINDLLEAFIPPAGL